MSIKAMSYVWENSTAKGSELLLLLAIADHAADDGYCWPTIDTLSAKIRMSERSVMRLVQALDKRGEIHTIRTNRNNRYIIKMGRDDAKIQAVMDNRKESKGDKLSHDKMTGDTDVTSTGDTDVTSTGDTDVTLIVNEPSINHHDIDDDEKEDGRGWFVALAELCQVELSIATANQKRQLGQSSKLLKEKASATPEQIASFGAWWYANDWRGKNGSPPTPSQVRETWGQFVKSNKSGSPVRIKV